MNTQDKMPSDMDAHMKSDILIPTTGDKKLPMEPSNKREKNADEQDAFERLVEDHDDSKTELATAKTAELHESTQSPKDTKHIPTAGTKPDTIETVSDALASTLASKPLRLRLLRHSPLILSLQLCTKLQLKLK